MKLRCAYCGRTPDEISDYVNANNTQEPDLESAHPDTVYATVDDYVWNEEGTLNRKTGMFACDECYIKIGMPTALGGWTVPDVGAVCSEFGDHPKCADYGFHVDDPR